MERIQLAIEKARASRNGEPPAAKRPGRAAAAPADQPAEALALPADAPDALQARWLALPEFHPDPRHLARNRIVSFAGGRDAIPFDVMRTKVLQIMRANDWKRLAITSPTSACGKTTTSLNLAFSLSRQPETRTALIEIDMRRPALAKALGLKTVQSFAKVLDGSAVPEAHLTRYGANLCFGTNTAPARNSAELLQNSRITQALDELEARYDPTIMIFDMPPMLVSDDMMAFLPQVDCVLLVAAAEASTLQEVDVCERELAAQTNTLGVILNKCRYLDKSYGYSYYGA